MARLEELTADAEVKGIVPGQTVRVVSARFVGSALAVVFKDARGQTREELIFRDREPQLEVTAAGLPWNFDADPAQFRRVLEAYRISLAALFDRILAVHTSLVDPLPHQLLAVYDTMLRKQPLRFVLADDPGAGKTIMAGLLIKELMVRGDLERCLIVAPGSLGEQWQDELNEKFNLSFEIATNDKLNASGSGNWFKEAGLVIGRLDKLARDEDVQAMLKGCEWDLVVVDEAHKMSATYFSGEVKLTRRFRLGQLLGPTTRNLLLMTATPHNGKDEDFQLFLSLVDGDQFEGRYRQDVHSINTSDVMRRMTKEMLKKFDGTPLFPERKAYVVKFALSDIEAELYAAVSEYVREEFNRAEKLKEGKKQTVGFALTVLQRRLASSPEAIFQSLHRRRLRLESELNEASIAVRASSIEIFDTGKADLGIDSEFDDDELSDEDREEAEGEVADKATAAQTIAELQAEIGTLRRLESSADAVRRSGRDSKWSQLRELLLNTPEMHDEHGHMRKLVIFTEHKDTLDYLQRQIAGLLGRPDAIVTISGSMQRADRRKAQDLFRNDKEISVLIATDAAGEGINLQRAHLMVNYDLPWNPNRLEQRFGRIHRIGQQEVCHLWNLLAEGTREGDVYLRLLDKLKAAGEALDGRIFDVLGTALEGRALRELMIDAIRYGQQPEVRARLFEKVDNAAEAAKAKAVLNSEGLATGGMDTSRIQSIREDMERANLRRLQPGYIEEFFVSAFAALGGNLVAREPGLWEITHVPARVRDRAKQLGTRMPVLVRYQRVTFRKEHRAPKVEFICPGHALFDATMHTTLEEGRDLLRQGSLLVDPITSDERPYALVTLSHAIRDCDPNYNGGTGRVVSKRAQFVKIFADGMVEAAGSAPHIDLLVPTDEQARYADAMLEGDQFSSQLEDKAIAYAVEYLVPQHRAEEEGTRLERLKATRAAVKRRLQVEIQYWSSRAATLREQELAGRQPKMNADAAARRCEELEARLENRLRLIDLQMQFASGMPAVESGAYVLPKILLDRLSAEASGAPVPERPSQEEIERVDRLAIEAVMAAERALGRSPKMMPHTNPGYDIESSILDAVGRPTGELVFIEVKGKTVGVSEVQVSATQIRHSLNSPERFVLAIVPVEDGRANPPRYVRRPYRNQLDHTVTSMNLKVAELLAYSTEPC
jgi:superfamily II DNA or RNA helicase